jgi:hypothetical protein
MASLRVASWWWLRFLVSSSRGPNPIFKDLSCHRSEAIKDVLEIPIGSEAWSNINNPRANRDTILLHLLSATQCHEDL